VAISFFAEPMGESILMDLFQVALAQGDVQGKPRFPDPVTKLFCLLFGFHGFVLLVALVHATG
jgi:hypothetical protein